MLGGLARRVGNAATRFAGGLDPLLLLTAGSLGTLAAASELGNQQPTETGTRNALEALGAAAGVPLGMVAGGIPAAALGRAWGKRMNPQTGSPLLAQALALGGTAAGGFMGSQALRGALGGPVADAIEGPNNPALREAGQAARQAIALERERMEALQPMMVAAAQQKLADDMQRAQMSAMLNNIGYQTQANAQLQNTLINNLFA